MRTLTRIGIPITRSRNDLSAFTRYELEVFRQVQVNALFSQVMNKISKTHGCDGICVD